MVQVAAQSQAELNAIALLRAKLNDITPHTHYNDAARVYVQCLDAHE